MQSENTQLNEIMAQMNKLRTDLDVLSGAFWKNNFPSSQSFNKAVIFTDSLQLPHYSSAPSVGVVGQVIEVGGVAYICTTSGNVASPAVWTVIGTQS